MADESLRDGDAPDGVAEGDGERLRLRVDSVAEWLAVRVAAGVGLALGLGLGVALGRVREGRSVGVAVWVLENVRVPVGEGRQESVSDQEAVVLRVYEGVKVVVKEAVAVVV